MSKREKSKQLSTKQKVWASVATTAVIGTAIIATTQVMLNEKENDVLVNEDTQLIYQKAESQADVKVLDNAAPSQRTENSANLISSGNKSTIDANDIYNSNENINAVNFKRLYNSNYQDANIVKKFVKLADYSVANFEITEIKNFQKEGDSKDGKSFVYKMDIIVQNKNTKKLQTFTHYISIEKILVNSVISNNFNPITNQNSDMINPNRLGIQIPDELKAGQQSIPTLPVKTQVSKIPMLTTNLVPKTTVQQPTANKIVVTQVPKTVDQSNTKTPTTSQTTKTTAQQPTANKIVATQVPKTVDQSNTKTSTTSQTAKTTAQQPTANKIVATQVPKTVDQSNTKTTTASQTEKTTAPNLDTTKKKSFTENKVKSIEKENKNVSFQKVNEKELSLGKISLMTFASISVVGIIIILVWRLVKRRR